jgi:hypothetical protein
LLVRLLTAVGRALVLTVLCGLLIYAIGGLATSDTRAKATVFAVCLFLFCTTLFFIIGPHMRQRRGREPNDDALEVSHGVVHTRRRRDHDNDADGDSGGDGGD